MKGKTLGEWIEFYEKKTGDKFGVPEGYRLFYMAERGFAIMKPDYEGQMVVVYQVCGDGRFWRDLGEMMGVQLGLKCIGSICTRHIKPYIRGFGWEILYEFDHEGKKRFLCQDSIGRQVLITHQRFDENGEPNYWVVSYFHKKASLDDETIRQLGEYCPEG